MSIEVKIDTDSVIKRIDAMRIKIAHMKRIDIGQELSEWQVEDMHRHRPFTMRRRAAGEASTKIRPHSLLEMLKSEGVALSLKERRHLLTGVRRNLKRPRMHKRHRPLVLREHRHWSMRPILRQELIDRLIDRVGQMVHEKLTWGHGS
jgi:hypothetical protein